MGNERDILRTGVGAAIVMERVAIGTLTVHVMEMVVAMEKATATQKAAVMLMVIDMGRTGMEVEVDMGRVELQMMAGMVKTGKKVVIVKTRWTPRWTAVRWTVAKWTARWTRWTARQIRQQMVLLSLNHPNARKVGGTVRVYAIKCGISCP